MIIASFYSTILGNARNTAIKSSRLWEPTLNTPKSLLDDGGSDLGVEETKNQGKTSIGRALFTECSTLRLKIKVALVCE